MLQKSPSKLCEIEICNDRIGANGFLNRRCVCAPDIEAILLAKMRKIFLQQYLPQPDLCSAAEAARDNPSFDQLVREAR
jgi:hypothetical protein